MGSWQSNAVRATETATANCLYLQMEVTTISRKTGKLSMLHFDKERKFDKKDLER